MSEIKTTHQEMGQEQQLFSQMRAHIAEARGELAAKEDEVARAMGEAAVSQMRVNELEAHYRESLEDYYLGEDREGRDLVVSGSVRAVVKRDTVWVFEDSDVENLHVRSVRMQHPYFKSDIHEVAEFMKKRADIIASSEDGTRYYIPEDAVETVLS